MKFLNFLTKMLMLSCVLCWIGCCCPENTTQKQTTSHRTKSKKVVAADMNAASQNVNGNASATLPNSVAMPHGTGMKIGFSSPVVAVNNQKAAVTNALEEPGMIEVFFPENTTQDITLAVMDQEGVEQILNGKIQVFSYTEYTKPGTLVAVLPDDSEMTYYNILHNGYGEITVTEYIQQPGRGEEKGKMLLQMLLGSKKKKIVPESNSVSVKVP